MSFESGFVEVARDEGLVSSDIAIVADFCAAETAWSIDAEVRIQAAAGYKTVFVHIPADGNYDRPVHPDLNSCVVEGLARPISLGSQLVRARLALIREPSVILRAYLAGESRPLPRLLADRVICIGSSQSGVSTPAADQRLDAFVRNVFGATTLWAAETETTRAQMHAHGLPVLEELWHPSVPPASLLRGQKPIYRNAAAVGCAGAAAIEWWNGYAGDMSSSLGAVAGGNIRILVAPGREPRRPFPAEWDVLTTDEISLRRFLGGLDFFVCCPAAGWTEASIRPVVTALALGIPTLLHPSMQAFFGDGPRYVVPHEISTVIAALRADESAYAALSIDCAKAAEPFGPMVHEGRLRVLAGAPRVASNATVPGPTSKNTRRKRVLFVSSNGVGLGHLTRQIAVARRLPEPVDAVFATMSQGFSVVEQFGFPVEYVPFVTQSGFDMPAWDRWLTEQLCQIVDYYAIDGLVFDGVNPFTGLIEVLNRRRSLSGTWIRRAMWRKDRSQDIAAAQRRFGLIIEPGEIAASMDQGPTFAHRGVAMTVPPICVLDDNDRLDRETAAAKLGLDPKRPAVLLQLGAGANFDIVSVIDTVLSTIADLPEVQPVIAEWTISDLPDGLWPNVPRLRTFPLSRYFGAFDFTISAAGYNSFHEIIASALPAIFLSNTNQAVDDQVQRAIYAEDHGAAINLVGGDDASLRAAVETLLSDRARWLLSANCRRLAQPNGAQVAADAIAALLD